jgi:hypothetical protein
MDEASKGALVYVGLLGFWDWLKRRMSDVLRAGCESAGAPVDVFVFGGRPMVLWMETPPPGTGKSLKLGS